MTVPNFYINRIKVCNFKSFENIDIELGRFNVIVGQNASGKSNLKSIFSFIKDIADQGLEDAVARQGGSDFILNLNSKDRSLLFEIHFESDKPISINQKLNEFDLSTDQHLESTTKKIIYKFSINFEQKSPYEITGDQLTIKADSKNEQKIITHNLTFSKINESVIFHDELHDATTPTNNSHNILRYFPMNKNELILETRLFEIIVPEWHDFITHIHTYNFEPRLLKSPSLVSQYSTLNSDGSNLAYVLNQIKKDGKKTKMLLSYLQDLLPFLKTVSTEYHQGFMEFNLNETYNTKSIPAIFISDGTANIIALLICIFFQNSKCTVVEEPERNIHPGLLNGLMDLFDDASEINQIIITTHDTNILEYVPPERILTLCRDEQGNSIFTKFEDSEVVKKFKDAMPISTLMRQNWL